MQELLRILFNNNKKKDFLSFLKHIILIIPISFLMVLSTIKTKNDLFVLYCSHLFVPLHANFKIYN